MKRLCIALLSCLVMVTLSFSDLAQAYPLAQFPFPGSSGIQLTPEQKTAIDQLETEIIPQIEEVLKPEQIEEFEQQLEEGKSFRKAFKKLTLAPDQKNALAEVIKSLPKNDAFAMLTPDQKRAYFLNHKALFIPTSADIAEQIAASIETEAGAMPSVEEITEKIKAGMSAKEGFKPSSEEIVERIKAGMEAKGLSSEEITEKINLGMKKKEMYMPTLDDISAKISAKLKAWTQTAE